MYKRKIIYIYYENKKNMEFNRVKRRTLKKSFFLDTSKFLTNVLKYRYSSTRCQIVQIQQDKLVLKICPLITM